MKKEKAFTLVELLAVIVILAIILIIAVPGVLSIISKTKDQAYDRQIDMIKEAARNYVTADSAKVEWNTVDGKISTSIPLQTLQNNGYLDKKILDPRDKKEITCATTIVTKDAKNQLSYTVETNCGTKEVCFDFDKSSGTIAGYNYIYMPSANCPLEVIIPQTIQGTPVKKIGNNVFNMLPITSVVFPEGLETIGHEAFGYTSLTSVVIPTSVEYIGVDAFYGITPLKTIVIKGKKSLDEFDGLSSAAFPNGVPITFEP